MLANVLEELLPFLQKNEIWIYILLGAVALLPFQQLISAWRAWQGSVYGLEREIAQRRFSASLTILVLLVLLIFMEFVIVSFVVPGYPQLASFPTATLDLLATPTVTLPVAAEATGSAHLGGAPTATGQAMQEGCIPGQIEWISPKAGDEITANIQLTGTVNVPNLGFYKYEFSKQGENNWTTIAGGDQPKIKGDIGFWYTDQLGNGDYQLRLVVTDNQNKLFPACIIQVRISNPK
jgi:hypothetical protein